MSTTATTTDRDLLTWRYAGPTEVGERQGFFCVKNNGHYLQVTPHGLTWDKEFGKDAKFNSKDAAITTLGHAGIFI